MVKNVYKEWIELSEGCLVDGPPKTKTHHYWLFVNHCRVKKLASGRLVLERRTGVHHVEAPSGAAVRRKVQDYVNRPEVRLLRKDIESNDFKTLPKRQLDVPESVVTGHAEIYQ